MSHKGWIGVDLDGTLAHYEDFISPTHIGEPIPLMINRVKTWLEQGIEVRIFTARVFCEEGDNQRIKEARQALEAIIKWSIKHIGVALQVTCTKDYSMWKLYDDRCIQVEKNTGIILGREL